MNAVTDKDKVVTGTAEPNSSISVKSGTTFIGKGKANSQGVFSIVIPLQKAGTRISVIVKDSAGNSSPFTTISVLDKTPPTIPNVNKLTSKDTVITGTTEPNTDVNVKVASTLIGKGKANSKGQFSIKIPVQKMGTRVSVVVRDSAGNYSPSKVIEVSK